jgi:hypothetical protein
MRFFPSLPSRWRIRRATFGWLLCWLSLSVVCGCQRGEQITRYTVKKLPPAERRTAPATNETNEQPDDDAADAGPHDRDRMLAALVPHGQMAWFFKLVGPREAVGEQMENFLALIKSLKFANDESPPEWTLPDGWTAEKGNRIRFATLKVESSGEPLECSVIPLPADKPAADDYVLANVNRWCGEMGIKDKTREEVFAAEQPRQAEVQQFDAAGTKVTLVNLIGRMQPKSMGGAPFAPFAQGRRPDDEAGELPPARTKENAATKSTRGEKAAKNNLPPWTLPLNWQPTAFGQFQLAAFAASDGTKSVKISVSVAGGDVLANVNRWRGQLQLKEWSSDEFSKAANAEKLSVDGIEATYVVLVGDDMEGNPACTLGVIVPRGEQSWFFKLTGDVELGQREKPNFEKFVQSVTWK